MSYVVYNKEDTVTRGDDESDFDDPGKAQFEPGLGHFIFDFGVFSQRQLLIFG